MLATTLAVIGTRDITLSDGTSWRLPSTGFFNVDGTNQEHNGCMPDISVDISPADLLAGRDPQMDKAIEVLLDQLKNGKKKLAYGESPEDALEILRIRLDAREMAELLPDQFIKINQRELQQYVRDLG